jgi:hypothetical protein
VGDAGRLDRTHLLDLEVADVLEQPLAVPEQDRDEVQLELIDQSGGKVLLDDAAPPPSSTSRPSAACLACSRADSMPSVTKKKAVPPSISRARGDGG